MNEIEMIEMYFENLRHKLIKNTLLFVQTMHWSIYHEFITYASVKLLDIKLFFHTVFIWVYNFLS